MNALLIMLSSLYTFSAYATLDGAQWKCPTVLPTAKELRNSQFFSVGNGIVAFPLHAVKGKPKAFGLLVAGFFPSGTESRNSLFVLPEGY